MRFLRVSLLTILSLQWFTVFAQTLDKSDDAWIKKVINNWTYVCDSTLQIERGELPWMILYNKTNSWHINPDLSANPPVKKTALTVEFSGKQYPLYVNDYDSAFWVPERSPIIAKFCNLATAPYSKNQKAFFYAPLPSMFHALAPPDESKWIDLMILGTSIHELIHTKQLPYVVAELLDAQKKYNLPESFDDNTIENLYNNNEEYKSIFYAEKLNYWHATYAPTMDSCKNELRRGVAKTEIRWNTFFSKDKKGFAVIDDIFISLEGSAMYGQYKVTVRNAPPDFTGQTTLFWMLEHTNTWSQEEGLAVFLLLDRLVPDWKKLYFGRKMPSAFELLKKASK